MLLCKFCHKECKNENSLRNHERLCKSNPNRQVVNIKSAQLAASVRVNCEFCNEPYAQSGIKKHTRLCDKNPNNEIVYKNCLYCNEPFRAEGDKQTCSYACSNKYFRSGENNGNYGKGLTYRSIAKYNHEIKCIVCSEENVVAIHHYDEVHTNNDPCNLVPLCPTHHVYVHSRFKYLIIDKIDEYVSKQKEKFGQ